MDRISTTLPPTQPPLPSRILKQGRSLAAWLFRLSTSDLGRQVSGTLLTRIGLLGLGIVLGGLAARLLGPEGRGELALAETIAALGVQFGLVGLHTANTYFVARERSLLPSLIGNSLAVAGGVAILTGGAGVILGQYPGVAPVSGLLLVMAFAAIPLRLLTQLLQNLMLGVQEVKWANGIDVASCLFGTALVLPFLFVGSLSPSVAFALSLVATLFAVFSMLWRLNRHCNETVKLNPSLLGTSLGYGFWVYLACLLMYLVLKIDLLLLKYLVEPDKSDQQVGYYSVSVAMGDFVCLVPTIVGSLLFPRLSAVVDPVERWSAAGKVAWLVAGLAGLVGGSLALFAAPLVRIVYGDAFLPAVAGFWALVPGVVFLSINVIFMNYFAASGQPWIIVYSPGVAALLNVAVNLLTIPLYGFVGAAMASTLCYALMLAFSIYQFLNDAEGSRR